MKPFPLITILLMIDAWLVLIAMGLAAYGYAQHALIVLCAALFLLGIAVSIVSERR